MCAIQALANPYPPERVRVPQARRALVGPSGLRVTLRTRVLIPHGEALVSDLRLTSPYLPERVRVLVGPSGLEPPTSCLSGTRSNHLSYEPVSIRVRTLCVLFSPFWWR